MELLFTGAAIWALLAVCLGILLGRSAREAEAAELGPEPAAGDVPAAVHRDRQAV